MARIDIEIDCLDVKIKALQERYKLSDLEALQIAVAIERNEALETIAGELEDDSEYGIKGLISRIADKIDLGGSF